MKKLWLVFKHEYLHHVLRKRFILAILSVPLFIAVILGVGILAAVLSSDSRPVGYIDQSGLFADAKPLPQGNGRLFQSVTIEAYPDEQAAQAALDEGKIQAIFIIHPDYYQTGAVTLIAQEASHSDAIRDFSRFLLSNLLAGQPADVRTRIISGANVIVRSVENDREFDTNNPFGFLVSIFSGVLFMIAINTSGGYLLQAVVDEKENRTMEIILTSISTDQLMAGKIIGNLSVGLTQLAIWLGAGIVGILVATRSIPEISRMGIDFSFAWLMVATFLPAFIMIAALMAMVGATATEAREAQQIAGLFSLPIVIPFWFIGSFMNSPNSPLAIAFTLFPMTAPLTLPLRAMFTNVPAWQIGLSIGLLVFAATGAIWLASRAFRLGMLRYGKKLSLREIFQKA